MAGALDRAWLRVAPLGGQEGAGHGRAEWERRYYPEQALDDLERAVRP